jgi:phosphoenolpyruvate phosphomutase
MPQKDIRRLLAEKSNILVVGAHDGMGGILGEQAGFDAIWASGFEISASHGVPDANILDVTDQLAASCAINEAVSIPVIADCDNGYGNAVNVAHAAKRFWAAGIAGFCIEDNIFPKRCSFYEGKRELASAKEHALKIRAAKDSTDGRLFVIGRTEAFIAGYDIEEALERSEAYADAGADAVLVHSRESTAHQLIEFAARWRHTTPLVSVPTTYDTIAARELHELGYKIVIYPNQGIRSAIKAVQESLRILRSAGHASVLRDRMVTLKDVFKLVNVEEMEDLEKRYLPQTTHSAPAQQVAQRRHESAMN